MPSEQERVKSTVDCPPFLSRDDVNIAIEQLRDIGELQTSQTREQQLMLTDETSIRDFREAWALQAHILEQVTVTLLDETETEARIWLDEIVQAGGGISLELRELARRREMLQHGRALVMEHLRTDTLNIDGISEDDLFRILLPNLDLEPAQELVTEYALAHVGVGALRLNMASRLVGGYDYLQGHSREL